MSDLTRCILLIVLLLCSAYFSMTECAFSYCNQIKLKVLAEEGKKSAKLVLKCLDKFDRYIVVSLVGNNIVNILFSVLSTILCVTLISKTAITNVDGVAAVVSTIFSTLVVFFGGEIIPKSIGKAFPNTVVRICVYPLVILGYILTPIVWVFSAFIWNIKKIFKANENEPLFDEEDFQDIVDSIEEKGLIEEQESNIIQSAVDFDDTKVKQVMCFRKDICALDIEEEITKDQLIDFILDKPYTRIPVYKGNIDNIIGILHTQKLLKQLMKKGTYNIEKLLVEPIFVRPNVHLDTLFEEFKKKRTHMAVVQDKEGKTLGIVTMEDLSEELVGDIDENEGGEANG